MARAGGPVADRAEGANRAPGSDAVGLALPADLIRLGVITGIHGVRGALRYKPDNPASDSLKGISSIVIETDSGMRRYRVRAIAQAGRGMLKIELEDVADADSAEALKGGIVMVSAADLPPTQSHEFYYFQAIGCEVMLTDGSSIGTVAEMFFNGANDVMVVRQGNREVLIPVIEDVVKSIDVNARRVVVDPIPGLLD